MCLMPIAKALADDRHVCPDCEHNVHGICGVENDHQELKYKTTCFLCVEKNKAPGHSTVRTNLEPRLATCHNTGADSKRPPDSSLRYDASSDEDDELIVPSVIADCFAVASTSANSDRTSENISVVSKKQSKPRPKKRGKNSGGKTSDSLLIVNEQFIYFDHYYVSKTSGNPTSHIAGVCSHCQNAYNKQKINYNFGKLPPKPPKEMALYAAPMSRHLKACDPYKKALSSARKKDGIVAPFSAAGTAQLSLSPVTFSGLSLDEAGNLQVMCKHCHCCCQGKRKPGSLDLYFPPLLSVAQVDEVHTFD